MQSSILFMWLRMKMYYYKINCALNKNTFPRGLLQSDTCFYIKELTCLLRCEWAGLVSAVWVWGAVSGTAEPEV